MTQAIDLKSVHTIHEAAQRLGATVWQLKYLITSGKCEDVRQLSGRRVFTEHDLGRFREGLRDTYSTVRRGE